MAHSSRSIWSILLVVTMLMNFIDIQYVKVFLPSVGPKEPAVVGIRRAANNTVADESTTQTTKNQTSVNVVNRSMQNSSKEASSTPKPNGEEKAVHTGSGANNNIDNTATQTQVSTRETSPDNSTNEAERTKLTACSWNNNLIDECFHVFQPLVKGTRQWYFFGDSTLARPFQAMFRHGQLQKTRDGGRKKNKFTYYQYRANPSIWVPPNYTRGEGPRPTTNVKAIPFQTTCTTCINTQARHKTIPNLDVEFLAVEYALDVEFPTETTRTSQETAVKYITEQRVKHPTLAKHNATTCIVNGGFHDMVLQPPLSADLWVSNVRSWQKLLKEHVCRNIIWINLNAAREMPGADKRTIPGCWNKERLMGFNAALKHMMEEEGDGILWDIYPRSLNAPHADLNHMNMGQFYHPMADFMLKLMTESAPKQGENNTLLSLFSNDIATTVVTPA